MDDREARSLAHLVRRWCSDSRCSAVRRGTRKSAEMRAIAAGEVARRERGGVVRVRDVRDRVQREREHEPGQQNLDRARRRSMAAERTHGSRLACEIERVKDASEREARNRQRAWATYSPLAGWGADPP